MDGETPLERHFRPAGIAAPRQRSAHRDDETGHDRDHHGRPERQPDRRHGIADDEAGDQDGGNVGGRAGTAIIQDLDLAGLDALRDEAGIDGLVRALRCVRLNGFGLVDWDRIEQGRGSS